MASQTRERGWIKCFNNSSSAKYHELGIESGWEITPCYHIMTHSVLETEAYPSWLSHHITPHHSTSHYITSHYTTPHHTTPHYTASHYTTQHHITSHYIAPQHSTPHSISIVYGKFAYPIFSHLEPWCERLLSAEECCNRTGSTAYRSIAEDIQGLYSLI